MTIWTILALLAMCGVALLIGRWMQRVGYDYPEPTEPEDTDFIVRTERGIQRGVVIDPYPVTQNPITVIPGAPAPMSSTEWQERARRAEALGFMDDEPKRSA